MSYTLAQMRMAQKNNTEVGRDLWRLSSLTSLPKAGSARAGCPGSCPDGVCVSARMETP